MRGRRRRTGKGRLRRFRPDLSALREPGIRRLLGAKAASMAGDGMVLVAMAFAVYELDGGDPQLGYVMAAFGIAYVATLPVGGVLGDRYSKRQLMIAADLLRFGSQAFVAVLWWMGDAAIWQLVVAQVPLGIGSALFRPAANAIVPELAGAEQLQGANALRALVEAVGNLGGPAIGVALLTALGPGWVFGIDAASFLASAVLLAGLPLVPAADPPNVDGTGSLARQLRVGAGRWWIDVKEGWVAFRSRTWLWVVVGMFTLINGLMLAPFFVFAPSVAEDSMGGAAAWMVMLIAIGAGEIVGSLIAAAWKPERPLLVGLLVFAVWIVPLVLLAAAAPLVLIAAGLVVAGVGQVIFGTVWDTTLQTHVDEQHLARVSAIDEFGGWGLVSFGRAAAGWTVAGVGAAAGLYGGAALVAVTTAGALAVPSVRNLPREPNDGTGPADREGKAESARSEPTPKPVVTGRAAGETA